MRMDRIILRRMGAMLDLDLGRYAQARTRLEELLAQTESPEERAVQLRVLGSVHLGAGDPTAALAAAQAALALADPTEPTPEPLLARQLAVLAQALLGEFAVARTEIDAAIRELRATIWDRYWTCSAVCSASSVAPRRRLPHTAARASRCNECCRRSTRSC
jgi:tetratricopeptide (TPR) repeat protein